MEFDVGEGGVVGAEGVGEGAVVAVGGFEGVGGVGGGAVEGFEDAFLGLADSGGEFGDAGGAAEFLA